MGLNIEDVLRANDEMSEAIQRVRELHKPYDLFTGKSELVAYACEYCTSIVKAYDAGKYEPYPCLTIQALDGEK